MATTTRPRSTKGTHTRARAARGTKRNPARGVVDLREKGRPNARRPFYATWYDAVTKRKGGSKPFETLPEAVRWIEQQERDNLAAYHRGEGGRAQTRAIRTVAEEWARTLTKATNTMASYRTQVRELIKHFGEDTPIGAIEPHDVQNMVHHMLMVQGRRHGTVKARINVLSQVMEYAVDRRFRPDNPCRRVDRPREQHREAFIFTDEQISSVLPYLPGHMRAAVLLAYYGGLRIGEVLGLRVQSVDLSSGVVKLKRVLNADGTFQDHTKGSIGWEYATLPKSLLPVLAHLIETYPAMQDGTLFSHRPNREIARPLSQGTLRRHFRAACKSAGLPVDEIRFHDLRHSCATNYARGDAPAYVIQAMLRHARMDTSQRYIDRVQDEKRRAWANRVGAVPAGIAAFASPDAA